MQLGADAVENEKRWAAVPALAAISPLGSAKPGASVLAVTGGPGGAARALVAVQRFGDGRSMVFTGEASWRWRMMLPTSDQSYERFWRQAVRWLAQNAPEPVTITLPGRAGAGDAIPVVIAARDAGYAPRADAIVDVRVTSPSGRVETVHAAPVPRKAGQFRASVRATETGRLSRRVDARQGQTSLGTSSGTMLVGRRRSRDDGSAPERRHAAAGGARIRRRRARRRRYRARSRSRSSAGGAGRGARAAQGSLAHRLVVRNPGRAARRGVADATRLGAEVRSRGVSSA